MTNQREKSKVPELRFPEFSGEWEEKDLSSIIDVNSGKDYKHLNRGDIPVYGTGGLMLYVDEKLSDRDGVGIGRKGSINKPQLLKAPYWTVDTLFYCIPKINNDLYYIYTLYQKINWLKYDESTGVPSLSKATINKIKQYFPEFKEQQKIGEFFSKLDRQIELEEKKLALLEEQKKGYMQKIFSQELRFKDENDEEYPEWESSKLGNIVKIRKGTQLDSIDKEEEGSYYHLNGGKYPSGKTNSWNTEANTISISEGGNSCGFVKWNNERFFSGGHNYTLKINENISNKFLYFHLKYNENRIMSLRVGSGLPNIQKKDLESFSVKSPSLTEQTKIAKLLSCMERKCNIIQHKIGFLKNCRREYLNKILI